MPLKVQGTKEKQINEQHQESRKISPRMKENICVNTHTMDNIAFLIYDTIKYLCIYKKRKKIDYLYGLYLITWTPLKADLFSGWWQKEMRKCYPYLP